MQAVLIAAGESSRFWPLANGIHKSQLFLLGKPLMYWTLKGLAEHDIKNVVVVHGRDSSIPAMLEQENDLGLRLSYAVQEKPLGTGNALFAAKKYIKDSFFVFWPNKVNSGELVGKMLEVQKKQGAKAVFVGAFTKAPWDYGVARMEGERLAEIVENPKQGHEPSNTKVVGAYLLESDYFSYYGRLSRRHEADFVEALNLYLKDKKASLVMSENDVPALKYPWDLFSVLDILFRSRQQQRIIHPTAKIGEGTAFEGPVYIGEKCEIGPHNVLRGPLNIEKGTKTGAFFEIKHSVVQEGTHFHSGYIGDSLIGKNCRFGAGFVAANRRLDRKNIACEVQGKRMDTDLDHLGAVVGEETSIGIQAGTMPGVFVGARCQIGPGTIVFENVPDNTSLFARFEQKNSPC